MFEHKSELCAGCGSPDRRPEMSSAAPMLPHVTAAAAAAILVQLQASGNTARLLAGRLRARCCHQPTQS